MVHLACNDHLAAHHFTSNCPDKAHQLPSYGGTDLNLEFTSIQEMLVAPAQPLLRLPGNGLYFIAGLLICIDLSSFTKKLVYSFCLQVFGTGHE